MPNSPYMLSLVIAVIGERFPLFGTGDELNDGKKLSPDVIKMNSLIGKHLTGVHFIKNVPNKARDFDKSSGLKSYKI